MSEASSRAAREPAKTAKAGFPLDILQVPGFNSPSGDRESLRAISRRASPSAVCYGTFIAVAHTAKMVFND